ncbi:MAG: TetR/AcrR family transcriptional regulator [Methylococcaceae bacterium]|nr:TetR/AcrR family transcriptional regulator [Methylococcaceae bacterium]
MARPIQFDKQTAIDQALCVFRKQGYKGSSLHDLIRAMNISKSSFYETFGSKYELFLITLARFHETEAVYQFINPTDNISAKTVITNIFKQLIDSVINGKGGCLFGNCAVEFSDTDANITTLVTSGIKQLEHMFYQILIHDQKNKAVLEKHKIQTIARQLTATFYGLQIMANANLNRKELNEIASNSVAILD